MPRATWFAALRAAIAESYLADPANPYRQSGRSRGAERWAETRRCVGDAIPRGGDIMDVGCANGLLLESVIGWCAERGLRVVPHGIDFVPELVALARERHPAHAANFEVANAWSWHPLRRYDVVRASVECVPAGDRVAFVRRLFEEAVAPGGRLVACHYASKGEALVDVGCLLAQAGLSAAGGGGAERVAIAWVDRPPIDESRGAPSPA